MTPIGWRRGRATLVGLLFALVATGCGPTEPSPSPAPIPAAPALRPGSPNTYTFDGKAWTFKAFVDPHGLPTDVTLEWGVGPTFDHSLPMAAGLTEPQAVTFTTKDLPPDGVFCATIQAANDAGSTLVDAYCETNARSPIVVPEPSPSG